MKTMEISKEMNRWSLETTKLAYKGNNKQIKRQSKNEDKANTQ